MTNQNFVGVKVGDVNGSAVANANNETVESRSNVVLMTENKAVEANTIHSAVFSSDIEKVYGLSGERRKKLMQGLREAITNLEDAGVKKYG